jgi:hypothetical protein
MTPSDPDEIAKQAREHAWNWFALHATQRMQAFNFFVVATAYRRHRPCIATPKQGLGPRQLASDTKPD